MTYRRKPQVVTADRFAKCNQPWPNGVCICSNDGFWGLHVHTQDGPKHIPDGAWVIRNLEGVYDVLTEEDFQSLYEPMP